MSRISLWLLRRTVSMERRYSCLGARLGERHLGDGLDGGDRRAQLVRGVSGEAHQHVEERGALAVGLEDGANGELRQARGRHRADQLEARGQRVERAEIHGHEWQRRRQPGDERGQACRQPPRRHQDREQGKALQGGVVLQVVLADQHQPEDADAAAEGGRVVEHATAGAGVRE